MEKQKKKLKRTAQLISILSKYGFNELLIQSNLKKVDSLEGAVDSESLASKHLYERIRMVLEELGPTYVKLGQTFSNREDLLPIDLIIELKKLQDRVEPLHLDIHQIFKDELEIQPEDYFREISAQPLASASISQVYRATLLDGRLVILKIKRPHIKEKIVSDLLIMKDLARLLVASSEAIRKINLLQVIETFEKSIHEELSFLNEMSNMEQFTHNFKDNPKVHPVYPYRHLSNDNILCMDFVAGDKITNKDQIIRWGLNPIITAKTGLDLYLTQVIEHGFFHADPHPGNLFIMENGQIAFIDFGSMGRMIPSDKELLEDFISHFIAKDAKRLIRTIKKMALELHIEDEKKLERQIESIFELLNAQSLDQIEVKTVIKQFTAILNNNEILMPEYMYLLVRGIVLIEGIGRELDPNMNLTESVKPYITKIIMRRISPEYIWSKGSRALRDVGDGLREIPDNTNQILHLLKEGRLTIQQENKELSSANKAISTALNRLAFTVLIGGFCTASALLIMADRPPKLWGIPLFGLVGLLVSSALSLIVLLSIFKKDK